MTFNEQESTVTVGKSLKSTSSPMHAGSSESQISRVSSIALIGVEGIPVVIEAAVANQLPGITLIGLPDTALGEAKQRVRLAAQNAGLNLSKRMLVINLSPAALPKHGSGFDLGIALGALAASGSVAKKHLERIAHLGELSLDGTLRRPQGLFTAVAAAHELGFEAVMVPAVAAQEALLVPGIHVIPVSDLGAAVRWHTENAQRCFSESMCSVDQVAKSHTRSISELRVGVTNRAAINAHLSLFEVEGQMSTNEAKSTRSSPRSASAVSTSGSLSAHNVKNSEPDADSKRYQPDMSDVIGQPDAVEAFVVAAVGRHHISVTGPPGAGKSLLAACLPTILPSLSDDDAVRATRIAALGNNGMDSLVRTPPFESPHHTASAVSIIGGVDGAHIRPGAITKASWGVLFFDEAPEFSKLVLESLRQPLETRNVHIHRARTRVTLPAEFQLVLASNPCGCGYAQSENPAQCKCTPNARIRYSQRLSGPLLDRVDVKCTIRRVSSVLRSVSGSGDKSNRSYMLRERVTTARAASAERFREKPWSTNAEIPGSVLRGSWLGLPRTDTIILDRALARGNFTLRGYDRILRLAWSIADLSGKTVPKREEIAAALALRGGY